MPEKYWPWAADYVLDSGLLPPAKTPPAWAVLRVQLLPSLIQIYKLIAKNIQGCRGLDGAPCGARVHKHLRYVVSKVDLAVGCDGFVLHQLQVLRS